jgi:putative transposase
MDTSTCFYRYRQLTEEERQFVVRDRQQRGYPWHGPPHRVREANYYLFSAANFEHSPVMSSESRRLAFQTRLLELFGGEGIGVCAWAVLPNHYHVLALVPDISEAASVFQRLHGSTSRQWNLEDNRAGRKVWYRYSDRAIRSEKHFYATVNYLHFNPVKHGHVERVDEWATSSFGAYMEAKGREWLAELWRKYPVKDYGKGWDW